MTEFRPDPPSPEPGPAPPPSPEPAPDITLGPILSLLDLHNAARAASSLQPLVLDPKLITAAQGHADWMARTETMSHTGAGGSSMSYRIQQARYAFRLAGENIAYGPVAAKGVHEMWMNSAGHRRNILNSNFVETGMALSKSARGTTYWCVVFARPGTAGMVIPTSDEFDLLEFQPPGIGGPAGY